MPTTTHIRWSCKNDLQVMEWIEAGAFADSWSQAKIANTLREQENGCQVIETGGRVVGYVMFKLSRQAITILRLAVGSSDRRCGHGSALVHRIEEKALDTYRRFVRATSDTADVRGNKFLAACGLVPGYCVGDVIHWSKEVSGV